MPNDFTGIVAGDQHYRGASTGININLARITDHRQSPPNGTESVVMVGMSICRLCCVSHGGGNTAALWHGTSLIPQEVLRQCLYGHSTSSSSSIVNNRLWYVGRPGYARLSFGSGARWSLLLSCILVCTVYVCNCMCIYIHNLYDVHHIYLLLVWLNLGYCANRS